MTMPTTITRVDALDIRFPTSRERDGSDAMSPDPDYSAAYAILHTDRPDGLTGHGLTFTAGRGNELCVAAIRSLTPLVQGLTLEHIKDDMAGFWRRLTSDSQMRWVGPEKGVLHLATAAVVNAVWDLYAKIERKPLWKLLADLSPEALVRCIDFRYITDALTPDEALMMLRRHVPTRAAREGEIRATDIPPDIRDHGRGLPVRVAGATRDAPGKELEFIFRTLVELKLQVEELRRRLEDHPQRVEVIEVGAHGAPSLGAITADEGADPIVYRRGMTMAEVERAAIEATLKETRGNRRKAADVLGIGERTLYRKLKEYQLA